MHPVSALVITLFEIIDTLLWLYMMALIVSAVMSWLIAFNVINTRNRFVQVVGDFLYRITEPAYSRIRRFIPPVNGLDLSPLILIFVIWALRLFMLHLVFG